MKQETIQIRLTSLEKKAFARAADLAGISVSAWVRERLRTTAARELEAIGEKAAFIERLSMGDGDE
jgi:hypothetical protein